MSLPPLADFRRAMAVARQWHQTAAITGSTDHAHYAHTCTRIAAERFAIAAHTMLSEAERLALRREEQAAIIDMHLAESRVAIAESLALLDRVDAQLGRSSLQQSERGSAAALQTC
jgi:hypothetical protein